MKHKSDLVIIHENDEYRSYEDMVMVIFVSGEIDEAEAIRLGGIDGAYIVDDANKRWAYVYEDDAKISWEGGLTGVDHIDNVLRGNA